MQDKKEREAELADAKRALDDATQTQSSEYATLQQDKEELVRQLTGAKERAERLQDELDALAASVTPVAGPKSDTAGTGDRSIAEMREKALREFGCENNAGVMVLNECRPLDTKELDLAATDITDLTPLAALTELEALYLWDTQVSDLRALEGLSDLRKLHLSKSQVSDLRGLEGLIWLRELSLTNTQVSDLRALKGMGGLQTLWLNATQVSDLSPLSGLKSLDRIELSGANSLSDLSPLLQLGTVYRVRLPDGRYVGDARRDTPENRAAVQQAIREWKP